MTEALLVLNKRQRKTKQSKQSSRSNRDGSLQCLRAYLTIKIYMARQSVDQSIRIVGGVNQEQRRMASCVASDVRSQRLN